MRLSLRLERPPLESREPVVYFALIRALIAMTAVVALAILGFPYEGRATAVLAGVLLPWSLGLLAVTRREPETALNPMVALGDFVALGLLLAVEPALYAPTHFAALFLVAAHAHFQGAQWSVPIGLLPVAVLVPITATTEVPVERGLTGAYEAVFAAACVSAALVVGALRTAESSGRLRARAVSRRAIDTETAGRRRFAQVIHDGPIQELSSVELMLASAEQALARGDRAAAEQAVHEARALTRSNVRLLRDEIVELGPHAFEERSYEQAVADCVEVWERRYGFRVGLDIDDDGLTPEVAGALFQITQEAVTNAGKHAAASTVNVRLGRADGHVMLEIADDGCGFRGEDPLSAAGPGHIGLASMRERAEMLGGDLAVDGGDGGTRLRVVLPA